MGIFDEGLSNLTEHLSFEKILSGDFSGVISLFYIAILIAIYSVVIYHFYRYISRRDCFNILKLLVSSNISVYFQL
jgi:hypothetical protein